MLSSNITASIITIGDELLIGQTIDTNSAWMAQQLNAIGIQVVHRIAVGDERKAIWKALDDMIAHTDIVLITGGLGPTADDITKPLLCDYFGGKMKVNEEVLAHVKNIFANILKRPLLERNLKQAEVPDTCKVLLNKRGTAPGMWFEKMDPVTQVSKIIVSMPGVPHEMKGLMLEEVIPQLKEHNREFVIHHRTLLTAGAGESFIAEKLSGWESALPAAIKLAYLPNYGMVRLRLTVIGKKEDNLESLIDKKFLELQHLLSDILVITEDAPLEKALGNLLLQKKKTIATAESCTGGYIAHLLTSIPGSSAYFKGSVIAYDNSIKENLLNVHANTLSKHGAVSSETVTEMLTGLLKSTKANYGIAVSGIMGPTGGTEDKPVGTVWIAVGTTEKQNTTSFHFRFDRQRNIQLTAANALLLMWKFIRLDG
jgi:nicotinamide-nucleotide amidase